MIDQALKAVEPFAQYKNLKIQKDIEQPLPEVIVDPHKIVWVLNNLLINAFRYNPATKSIVVTA